MLLLTERLRGCEARPGVFLEKLLDKLDGQGGDLRPRMALEVGLAF